MKNCDKNQKKVKIIRRNKPCAGKKKKKEEEVKMTLSCEKEKGEGGRVRVKWEACEEAA